MITVIAITCCVKCKIHISSSSIRPRNIYCVPHWHLFPTVTLTKLSGMRLIILCRAAASQGDTVLCSRRSEMIKLHYFVHGYPPIPLNWRSELTRTHFTAGPPSSAVRSASNFSSSCFTFFKPSSSLASCTFENAL